MQPKFDKPFESQNSFLLNEKIITKKEQEDILSNINVPEGSPASENLESYIEKLHSELPPKTKVVVEGKEMFLSDLAQSHKGTKNKKDFFVSYIKDNNTFDSRIFFLSRSNGVWRSLIGCTLNSDGEVDWNHKGYSEDSILLPLALQEKLTKNFREQSEKPVSIDQDLMYMPIQVVKDLELPSGKRRMPTEYEKLVKENGIRINQNQTEKGVIPNPESLEIVKEKQPNFSNRITTWNYTNKRYGEVICDVFISNDKSLRYLFARTNNGKAWIAGIESVGSPVNNLGLREEWVNSGKFTTPPYDYHSKGGSAKFQDEGYFDMDDRLGENYADLYKKYISKIPVIKEYQKLFTVNTKE